MRSMVSDSSLTLGPGSPAAVFVDHPLNAADLALDAPHPVLDVRLLVDIARHGQSLCACRVLP